MVLVADLVSRTGHERQDSWSVRSVDHRIDRADGAVFQICHDMSRGTRIRRGYAIFVGVALHRLQPPDQLPSPRYRHQYLLSVPIVATPTGDVNE